MTLVTRNGHALPFFWFAPLIFCGLAFGQHAAMRVTEPAPAKDGTIVTNESGLRLKGTLTVSDPGTRILWESNRGFSDLATVQLADDGQTLNWSTTTSIPLRPGLNHIRIKALGQSAAATFVNILSTAKPAAPAPIMRTQRLRGKDITYEVIDGYAVYQGDIILGRASDVSEGRFRGRLAAGSPKNVAHPESETFQPDLLSPTGLWTVINGVAQVPYTDDGSNPNVPQAIANANAELAGVIQWVPLTNQTNYVAFSFSGGGGACEASVGMVGGQQGIGGATDCAVPTIMHEMGHAMGLFHEQSRSDRNSYLNYFENNIDKPQHGNFDIASGVDSGLFNYASIMEYGPFSFNRDGVSIALETIPAGIVLGDPLPQYTTGDLDGIMRLYAHAPAAVTVDTNPTGLQVIVDGVTCTAPCVFSNWTLGSQHTLNVPLDGHSQTLQTLSQQTYVFGRWNASKTGNPQSVTVTNSAGTGTLLSPTTSPAITNYLASFIPVHPFSPVVAPGGDGTITSSPPPSTLIINGVSTNVYQDRQLITVTAHPNSGFSFYGWYNVPIFSFYSNPYTFPIQENWDFLNAVNQQPPA